VASTRAGFGLTGGVNLSRVGGVKSLKVIKVLVYDKHFEHVWVILLINKNWSKRLKISVLAIKS